MTLQQQREAVVPEESGHTTGRTALRCERRRAMGMPAAAWRAGSHDGRRPRRLARAAFTRAARELFGKTQAAGGSLRAARRQDGRQPPPPRRP